MQDARLFSPAAERNRDPILAVLRAQLGASGQVLELASGSGEHIVHFAQHLPGHIFQPSDPDAAARASIDAWVAETGLDNINPAIAIDAAAPVWPVAGALAARVDAVLCINMIHISPWAATEGLMRGAAQVLEPGGLLYLYGPYLREGTPTADGNLAFDASLRARDPAWGLRDLATVAACARRAGFDGPEVIEMPANNLSVCLRRR
jgi:SAM-dependent methyltransferase